MNKALSAASVNILNAITNSATVDYREAVPLVKTADQIKDLKSIIVNNPALANSFINSLMVMTVAKFFSDRMYENHLKQFKKGDKGGKTIETIYMDLIKAQQFDSDIANTKELAKYVPDVKVQFHVMNVQVYYPVSISEAEAMNALDTPEGIAKLVQTQVNLLYKSANYDEEQLVKYIIATRAYLGEFAVVNELTNDRDADVEAALELMSNFEFMSAEYNFAGVRCAVPAPDQFIVMSSKFGARYANTLASKKNMSLIEFNANVVKVDSFGKLDNDRLNALLGDNPGYHAFTAQEKANLDKIGAVICGREFIQLWDDLNRTTEAPVAAGLYRNYFYHTWRTIGTNIFENAAILVEATPSVTSVTVSPASVTLSAIGEEAQLKATVVTANFAPQTVVWESTNEDAVTVDAYGIIKCVGVSDDTVTIKAVSTYDGSTEGEATITVPAE